MHSWPASRALLAASAGKGSGLLGSAGSGRAAELLVISVVTPDSTLREAARAQMRDALREVLSLQLGCAPESVVLQSIPGQPLRVEHPVHGKNIGLSVSHEAGLSVAALRHNGPVGVDILRIAPAFDWQAVAHDYLCPQAIRRIAGQPESEQPLAFAREWTRLEAGLKCLGLALQEWSPALAERLESCRVMELDTPAGLCGAVACR
ncbi:4'-phosphopantetheinyl transferase superfamily protein [Polaromonas sp.]|uniref:4'-phosphopantetheinyl transferase family protein n=1 Tax=Polaromonas sp. TaxID=1869339 RepID=UPI0013BA5EB2|nr:4'-phosphopantetheinyl transferase superfamily protein [Polaromonas sp.]NDP62034.1 4'-phosphopantetheinyl transferase superfamily protein [Polaromonas sp.]